MRTQFAVFTEQGASVSHRAAAKFMDAIAKHELAEEDMLDVDEKETDKKTRIKNKDLFLMFQRWTAINEPFNKTVPRQFVKDLENHLGLKKKTVRVDESTRGHGFEFSFNELLVAMRLLLKMPNYKFSS